MAEPANPGNEPAVTPPATEPNANPSEPGNEAPTNEPDNSTFDIKSIPKEGWEQIYSSGRFKELSEKAKAADKLIKEREAAEEAALKEQGKWKELAEKAEERAKSVESTAVAAEIKAYAAKYGAVDLDDVAALADKSAVEFKDGTVTGAEDAVKALVESKPHLFNSNKSNPRVGSGTNPGDANNQGTPKFTHSQIRDSKFWAEHEKEILEALKNGLVVDDLKT